MNTREYRILSSVYLVLRDGEDNIERVRYHVKTGDYFAVLATALGFVEESLENLQNKEHGAPASQELNVLRMLKRDLLFLDERYDIREKAAAKKAAELQAESDRESRA